MISLILASTSPYRLRLLREAGYEVEACGSNVIEPDLATFSELECGLVYLAQLKAHTVARQGKQGLILGADTVSVAGGQILGKPDGRHHAQAMLEALSGTEHSVLTGWCLLRTLDSLLVSGVERTQIWMRSWTKSEITAYLDSGEWQGKCGAYGLQLPRDPFVTRLNGSASNVIGVPLERLQAVFAEFSSIP